MKYALLVRPAADADIDAAVAYLARGSITAARRFLDAVNRSLRELQAHPLRWAVFSVDDAMLPGLRKRPVAGFRNYLLFYLFRERTVDVIRMLHGARDIPAILRNEI